MIAQEFFFHKMNKGPNSASVMLTYEVSIGCFASHYIPADS